jgi:hypothetical protein
MLIIMMMIIMMIRYDHHHHDDDDSRLAIALSTLNQDGSWPNGQK